MRTTIRTLAAGATLALLLASCSLVEELAGPQQISDPFGLHGVDVTLRPGLSTAAAIPQDATSQAPTAQAPTAQDPPTRRAAPQDAATQQARAYGATFGPGTVSDIDASGIPDWFDPDSLRADVGIRSTVRIASTTAVDAAEFADTVVLDAFAIADFTIEDDSGDPRVELASVSTPAGSSVALAKQSCSVLLPVACTYEAQGGLDAFVIPVFVGGSAMDRLYAILTGGSPTNTASASFQLTATGPVPADATVTLTLDAPTGTLDP